MKARSVQGREPCWNIAQVAPRVLEPWKQGEHVDATQKHAVASEPDQRAYGTARENGQGQTTAMHALASGTSAQQLRCCSPELHRGMQSMTLDISGGELTKRLCLLQASGTDDSDCSGQWNSVVLTEEKFD